jgi:hypothetical protein
VPTPAEWEALRTAAAATQAVATAAAAATTNAPPPLTGAPPTNTVGTATNAPPSKEPPAPPPAQDSRPVAGLDVRACALRILASEAVIAHAARQAAAVRDDATIRLGLARQADTSAEAAALVTILTNGLARARACREEAFAQQERAKTAAARVASLKSGVEAARLEQARLAVETARRQAAEELARKQREEHDALVAEEKTRAQAVRGTCAKLVLEYRFAEAVKSAEVGAKACKTDAGRGAFGVLADRYRLLQDLKAFIIERLNGDPRPWIWGSGSSAKDVLGADDAYIRVKGGSVAWKDVPPAQVLKFVNVYENSSDLRVRRQCALLLAAAVYCYEFGGLNAAVTAKNYAASAVRLCQDLQADVDRLLIYEAP